MSKRTYVVSYINFFDKDLMSVSVEASNIMDAYYKGAKEFCVEIEESMLDVADIKDTCLEQDCMMEVFGPI